MKKIIYTIFVLFLTNCSFDNKTGIWKNNDNVDLEPENKYKDFKALNTDQNYFKSIILP